MYRVRSPVVRRTKAQSCIGKHSPLSGPMSGPGPVWGPQAGPASEPVSGAHLGAGVKVGVGANIRSSVMVDFRAGVGAEGSGLKSRG